MWHWIPYKSKKPRYRRRELILALEKNNLELASLRCQMQQLSKDLRALQWVIATFFDDVEKLDRFEARSGEAL